MALRQNGEGVRADLVRDVAVRGDAVRYVERCRLLEMVATYEASLWQG
jgi:hypothetical protein